MSEELPFKIKIMMVLGMVKVTKTEPKSMPKGFEQTRPKRRSFDAGSILKFGIPVIILLSVGLSVVNSLIPEEQLSITEQARIIAEKEGKNDWQQKEWDNPQTQQYLNDLKIEIDNSDCSTLGDMMTKNEGWTLRAYVAHSILERGC